MFRDKKQRIISDLSKKMVILTGPRQVGKTWLALDIAKEFSHSVYLNFDDPDHRQIIQKRSWLDSTNLIIFDELHKMSEWKNYLKGLFDTKLPQLKILVTGSARLETFRHVGDSLTGRYFLHHLLPFTLSELKKPTQDDQDKLIQQGGFPEPFLAKSIDECNRWRLQYSQGLIRMDILDFENIHDIKALQMVFELLRRSVGSPVSYQSIAEDVGISPNTVKKYIQIFEELFITFKITPYSKNIARSLMKEPKIYFYDTGMVVGDEGAKFENFVALSLLKYLKNYQDEKGIPTDLKYLKTKEKKEVDFCLVIQDKIQEIIEAKYSDKTIHPALQYFSDKYHLNGIQLVKNLKNQQQFNRIQLRTSFDYLKDL